MINQNAFYTNFQRSLLRKYIEDNYGAVGLCSDVFAVDEMADEAGRYVDVISAHNPGDDVAYLITLGMGAAEMPAPAGKRRVELALCVTPELLTGGPGSGASEVARTELTDLAAYPFEEDCWLGNGHTIDCSEEFKKTFGYGGFLLVAGGDEIIMDFSEPVSILMLIPVYPKELAYIEKGKMPKNDFIGRLYALADENSGDEIFAVDRKRAAVQL